MDIEQRLRESLAAREPPDRFEDAVLARLRNPRQVAKPPRGSLPWRWPAALAATVLAATFGLHWHAEQQRAAHNQQQLLLALAITSSQLEQVQQKLVRNDSQDSQENGT